MNESKEQKRVALVIAHLGPGGAQRVASTAANALLERGIEVHVVTVFDGPDDAYDLEPGVRRHSRKGVNGRAPGRLAGDETPRLREDVVGQRPGRFDRVALRFEVMRRPLSVAAFGIELARRTRWLRRTIRGIEPDAVLSFLTQTNIMTLLATRGLSVRTMVSERNDPRLQQHRRRVMLLRKVVYPWSDVVTANSYGALSALESFVPKQKLAFLPNPLRASGNDDEIAFAGPTVITVTRLVEQKGVDVLLKAAALAFKSLPGWRLAIVGDGPLRAELQLLAQDLGIGARIDWFGHVDDPMPYLRAARVFVLTSRFEGSPNALLEAMACGLPAIVSNASPGPLELIGDEEAGLIVPVEDAEATAEAIVRLAKDEALRSRFGGAALERTRVHQLDNAMRVWLELLQCA